jgi:outer membrane protein assembly factor BamB
MKAEDLVLVTVGYKVIALRKATGDLVWETVLVKKFFKPTSPFITLVVEESGAYAHTVNEIFRLDLSTGNIVWRKELDPGGWIKTQGVASIAMLGASSGIAPQAAKMQADRRRANDGGGGA